MNNPTDRERPALSEALALFDKTGRAIAVGDLIKVFHFIGTRRKRHYMYKHVVGVVRLGKSEAEYLWLSHLGWPDDGFHERLDGRTMDGWEIIQSIDSKFEDRPKPALTQGGVVELVARMIDPSSWRVMDSYLDAAKRKYQGQDAAHDPDAFKHKESLAKATEILTALERLAGERGGEAWRPIESAPKDATCILVGHDEAVFSAWWEESANGWVDGTTDLYEEYRTYEPTHWMPLPALPAAAPQPLPVEGPPSPDAEALAGRLVAIADAAQTYFDGYCQDEAADDGVFFTGCSGEQHRAARRLGDALAEYSPDQAAALIRGSAA